MGYGVSYPLRITARGGLATTNDNLTTILPLSLTPGRSGNPYNARDAVGLESIVWESSSPESEAFIVSRVEARFARLERISRREPIGGDDGVFQFAIEWANLETGASDETVLPSQT